jgi:hypothetical protein
LAQRARAGRACEAQRRVVAAVAAPPGQAAKRGGAVGHRSQQQQAGGQQQQAQHVPVATLSRKGGRTRQAVRSERKRLQPRDTRNAVRTPTPARTRRRSAAAASADARRNK